MKVVGFVGSPRPGGNTDIVVGEVLAGAAEKGAETRVYQLNRLKFRGCQACLRCKEDDTCALEDDMTPLYDEIVSADGIVLGTPIYMLQISGQTKIFLDRWFALFDADLSPRFRKGIKLVLVYAQAAANPEAFRQYFDYTARVFNDMGFQLVDTIVAAGAMAKGEVTGRTELIGRAKESGRKLVG